VIDANHPIEAQQSIARELIASKVDLSAFSTESSHAHPSAAARSANQSKPVPSTY
jgi:ABC-type sugar transport system substrate-binding protein